MGGTGQAATLHSQEGWSQICRWKPQGGPCTLNPCGASLYHVNENKYGDCDIS